MKIKSLIIALFCFATFNLKAQEEIFTKIENKTWFENSGFSGTSIIFYKTSNGLLKAIRQINGSGIPVISSEIYDVEIRRDSILLLNGLNLKSSQKVGNYYYLFNSKTGYLFKNDTQLKILSTKSVLYTWTDKRKNFLTKIDIELLKKTSININEIYKEDELILIQKDE